MNHLLGAWIFSTNTVKYNNKEWLSDSLSVFLQPLFKIKWKNLSNSNTLLYTIRCHSWWLFYLNCTWEQYWEGSGATSRTVFLGIRAPNEFQPAITIVPMTEGTPYVDYQNNKNKKIQKPHFPFSTYFCSSVNLFDSWCPLTI